MALFDKIKTIFRKSKKPAATRQKLEHFDRKQAGPPKPKRFGGEAPKIEPSIKKVSPKKKIGEVYNILKEPHISEKATKLFDEGNYTFKVFPWANKVQVKRAINDFYGVRVKDVKIINIKPKSRKLRGLKGEKRGYKKAVVILEKGEKIEIMPH
ncbi:MAG: 50S ribosomal protein L23 [Candidatus Portnoybacteria bacterium CG10_big_fil_rev_8_21_14_0_10_38_18]|uniref:Large ribosomal subunit protein uL23 n=1 Tax=Candidatus Portnoybacteria bacterium CG10_big_fil_rev_8_21_14_0_10_38_18 TaxID=1974813 RepID=A0A2M8KCF6_9BACT|nr:MAG: 50S ribosomal protein L23 [Candidatus Portnoybacteria bacterium CG10_big_fil_rev_8_21_14_0_10_38_18]